MTASDDMPIKIEILYGSIEIVTTEWREGDDLVAGGYSISRGRDGQEISRTKNQENCRLVGYYSPEVWRAHKPIEWPAVAWICATGAFIAWLYH